MAHLTEDEALDEWANQVASAEDHVFRTALQYKHFRDHTYDWAAQLNLFVAIDRFIKQFGPWVQAHLWGIFRIAMR